MAPHIGWAQQEAREARKPFGAPRVAGKGWYNLQRAPEVQLENNQLRKLPGEEGVRLGLEAENLYGGNKTGIPKRGRLGAKAKAGK